jgi:hypothetical protein
MHEAVDTAIRNYIDQQKARTEEQWWEETCRRCAQANEVQSPDDIGAVEMFDAVLALWKKELPKFADFRAPEIFVGGEPRARPVFFTPGAGVDLHELWHLRMFKSPFGGGNLALDKVARFIEEMNTSYALKPVAHDDRVRGLRSLRVPSLPSLFILFIVTPRRIVVVRLVYPGMEGEGKVPAEFTLKGRRQLEPR